MIRVLARLALIALLTSAFFAVGSNTPAHAAGPAWWNASYSDRLAINVHANDAITSGYSLDVVINHARLVSQGVSLASGDDVRIAYWNGTTWTELDRVLGYGSSWNNASTDVVFKTVAAVSASADDTGYYLYYGNAGAVSPPANANNVYALWDDFSAATLDTSKWQSPSTYNGTVNVSTTTGKLDLSGTTNSTLYNANNEYGITTKVTYGSGYRFDSSFSLIQKGHNNWKAVFGPADSILSVESYGTDKKVNYWNGSIWVNVGDSTFDAATFSNQRVSETLDSSGVAQHFENGVLQGSRTGAATGSQYRSFAFGPDQNNVTWNAQFDDIDVRKFVTNEPTVTIESANDIAFVASVAPVFSFTVATHTGGACNGATQTAGASVTGSAIALGRLNVSTPSVAVQDLTVGSNANYGFTVGVRSPALMTAGANTIAAVTGTNASPAAFGSGAGFGYTTNALSRFNSKWAGLTSTSSEVLSGTAPTTSTACVAYMMQVAANTPAASYAGSAVYTAVPTF